MNETQKILHAYETEDVKWLVENGYLLPHNLTTQDLDQIAGSNRIETLRKLVFRYGADPYKELRDSTESMCTYYFYTDFLTFRQRTTFRPLFKQLLAKYTLLLLLAKDRSRTMGDDRLNDNGLWRMVEKYMVK